MSVVILFALGIVPMRLPAAAWIERANLQASDLGVLDQFGFGVAIHGDRIAIGARLDDAPEPDSGSVYVFERDAQGAWFETAKLTAFDGGSSWQLGGKVAIWRDIIAATASGADPANLGAVYVFERGGDKVWRETAKLIAPDGSDFSSSVAAWGDTIVVGTELEDVVPDTGAVYVFERDAGSPGNWGLVAKLKASDGTGNDRFGTEVDLEGDRLVVGARNDGDNGEGSGSSYVFERQAGGEWIEMSKLIASDGDPSDSFGKSVAVSGNMIVVGAERDEVGEELEAGSAYVFEREAGGEWIEVTKLTASDAEARDLFGGSVGIDGDIVVAGAEGDDEVWSGSGAAYVFERDQGGLHMWRQQAKLMVSDAFDTDNLGYSVGISGQRIVAGSPNDDDGANNAGSASVFLRVDPVLAVTGTCPGPVALALTGATPNLPVALLGAASEGSAIVPSGRCAGTEVGLSAPKILTIRRVDVDGKLSLVRTLGPRACGSFLQVLDGFTCEVSGVERLP